MKFILLIISLTLLSLKVSSETTLVDLTCDGILSSSIANDVSVSGQFRLVDMGENFSDNLIMINGIPGFKIFYENDLPSTGNVLEFGEIKVGEQFGNINRVTGKIFLAQVETWEDGKGGKFNMTYSGKCKKTEKLF